MLLGIILGDEGFALVGHGGEGGWVLVVLLEDSLNGFGKLNDIAENDWITELAVHKFVAAAAGVADDDETTHEGLCRREAEAFGAAEGEEEAELRQDGGGLGLGDLVDGHDLPSRQCVAAFEDPKNSAEVIGVFAGHEANLFFFFGSGWKSFGLMP